MSRVPIGQVVDLVAARCPRSGDGSVGSGSQGGQEFKFGDACADLKIVAFIAKGTGHPATAGIEDVHFQTRDQFQGRDRTADPA